MYIRLKLGIDIENKYHSISQSLVVGVGKINCITEGLIIVIEFTGNLLSYSSIKLALVLS